jgi:hypothetical protein
MENKQPRKRRRIGAAQRIATTGLVGASGLIATNNLAKMPLRSLTPASIAVGLGSAYLANKNVKMWNNRVDRDNAAQAPAPKPRRFLRPRASRPN